MPAAPMLRANLAALLFLPVLAAPAFAAPAPTAPPGTRTRTFAVAVGAKTKQLLTLRLSAKEPADVRSKTHVDVAIGPNESVVKQTLSATVDAPAEMVIRTAETIDLNFDGHMDFWLVRDFGAKWAKYEAWVFEPKSGRYVQNVFTREIGQLLNPEIDPAAHTITTRSLGPSSPSRTVARVERGRMVTIESCTFDGSKEASRGRLVVKKSVQGVLKTLVDEVVSVKPGENPCDKSDSAVKVP